MQELRSGEGELSPRYRSAESFAVLPHAVRARIDAVTTEWVAAGRRRRHCLADAAGAALTALAHGCHQVRGSWRPFLECAFDDDKLLRCVRCYKNTVPEAGVHLGEIVAQFFQHCKQQSNLNVKKTTTSTTTTKEGGTANADAAPPAAAAEFRSNVDRKFEVFMSMKRARDATVVFRTVQNVTFSGGADAVARYAKEEIIGAPPRAEIVVHEFANRPGAAVYFSAVLADSKFDRSLDALFGRVDAYNESCESGRARPLAACRTVYCSDVPYFMNFSRDVCYDNCVTYLYCFMTDKYKPVVETRADSCVLGLVKILSALQCSTGCSLKRNNNYKMGHGPLTSVISEGGLNDSVKFVNGLFRAAVLRDEERVYDRVFRPVSPSYPPDREPEPAADAGRGFVINEPYINTFINRPVECGNMY